MHLVIHASDIFDFYMINLTVTVSIEEGFYRLMRILILISSGHCQKDIEKFGP